MILLKFELIYFVVTWNGPNTSMVRWRYFFAEIQFSWTTLCSAEQAFNISLKSSLGNKFDGNLPQTILLKRSVWLKRPNWSKDTYEVHSLYLARSSRARNSDFFKFVPPRMNTCPSVFCLEQLKQSNCIIITQQASLWALDPNI